MGKVLLWEVREAEVGGEEQAAGEKSREGGDPGGCIKIPLKTWKVKRVGFLGIIPQANAECSFPRVPSSNLQEFPSPAHAVPVFHLSTELKFPGGTFAE